MQGKDQEEEFKLLSGLMTDGSGALVDLVSPLLSHRDFKRTQNAVCYRGMLDVIADGDQLTPSALYSKVRRFEKVSEEYVNSLTTDGTGQGALVEAYALNIKDSGLTRKLATLSSEIRSKIESGDSPRDINKFIQDTSDEISDTSGSIVGKDTSWDYWFVKILNSMSDDSIQKNRFPTGFSSIDRFLDGGLEYGNVDIIAGRTGMGKTSFGLNMLGNVALSGIPSMMVSIEMTGEMITRKMIASRCKIREGDIMSNNLTEEQWGAIDSLHHNQLKNAVIHIDDKSFSLFDVETSIRHMVRKKGIRFVVIDYVQIIQVGSKDKRYLEIGETINKLKELAKRLNIHIMLLSQINRNVEGRTSKRPAISDLSESGKIEETASRVFLLYRDEYYNPDSEDVGIAEISLAKNRFGQTGTSRMSFLKEYTSFEDMYYV